VICTPAIFSSRIIERWSSVPTPVVPIEMARGFPLAASTRSLTDLIGPAARTVMAEGSSTMRAISCRSSSLKRTWRSICIEVMLGVFTKPMVYPSGLASAIDV
jgi:hypothetical protein